MRIEGRYRFAAPRQRVWAALQDPAMLAATLPGVRRLEVLEPDRYAVSLDLGVGAVRGTYDGEVTVADRVEGEACTLRGSGRGAAGPAEVEARVRLRDDGDGATLLDYQADARIAGPVAGVGQRMLAAAARKNAELFLGGVDQALSGAATPTAPATEAPATAAPATLAPVAGPAGAAAVAAGQVFTRPHAAADPELRRFLAGVAAGALVAL